MGRLPKKGVDYFSHDVNASSSPTLFVIESQFGNDGYAFWFKLLEFLGSKESLSVDAKDTAEWLYFVAKARVTAEQALQILDVLADTEAIDKTLWREHRVIWSDNYANRLSDVYRKRGIEKPSRPIYCEKKVDDDEKSEEEKTIPDKPKQKKKAEKSDDGTTEKVKYADFVKMKPEEYDILREKYGKEAADKCISVLDNYKGSKGKTYKDDYRAILSWVIDKVKSEYPYLIKEQQNSEQRQEVNPFGEYS